MKLLFAIFLQSLISALAITESGDTLVDINSQNMLVPASNMKAITTGVALNKLGSSFQWETKIGYSGEISDGVLHGDLYIIGGADPTLGSAVKFATPVDTTFNAWAKFVKNAGIEKIEGHIVGDGRYIEGPMEDPTWLWEDLGTYYGCGVSGLSFYENAKDFEAAPGDSLGAAVRLGDGYPRTPWMTYSHNCATGAKNTGDQLYFYTTRLAPVGSMTGTFALEKKQKVVSCSNKFPEMTCADYFFDYLNNIGIICTEGPADIGTCFGLAEEDIAAQKDLTIIGSTKSPSLGKVIRETNYESNNFMAETLFRTLGKVVSGSGSLEASRSAMNNELRRMGLATTNKKAAASIMDGSGLSRKNYVSPAFFCSFLKAMTKTKEFPVYLTSLPMVGVDGTTKSRLPGLPLEQRKRVRMKSGSMEGVRCYCGYILPSGSNGNTTNGKAIIFSYMVNNSTESSAKQNAGADEFIANLIKANL